MTDASESPTHPAPNPAAVDVHESVYDGLLGADDSHWAFGSFEDQTGEGALAGVDTSVPDGVDAADLAGYCLMLADDALIASHRLSEWCSRAPDLEDDIAMANIALDLLGQARLLLARAAAADESVVPTLPDDSPIPPEDALAFFREAGGFRNVRLVEPPHGDFAEAITTLLLFAVWRLELLQGLAASRDAVLAAVAAKGVKEVTYHRDYAARWFVTLAQGTEESRRRVVAASTTIWPHLAELFVLHPVEARVAESGVGVDPTTVTESVRAVLDQVLSAAVVTEPERQSRAPVNGRYGRDGVHTEELSRLLAEMQVVARAHPRGQW
ncbi:MAG: 1,2-phenylacetyl-CoA epoxidase subunit PaaC [Propionibacteriaceae bacterium]